MVRLLAFVLCCAGFAALGASMQKHAREVFDASPEHRRRMLWRVFGWALLAASVAACCMAWGAAVGVVAWFGIATVAVLAMAMALTVARRRSASRVSPRREMMS